ncbi:MAG: YdcF family protein [Endomicrobium sp.]|jgi:hypothetical protein|nr:YdcF family protein [Endomicrobium sp.]
MKEIISELLKKFSTVKMPKIKINYKKILIYALLSFILWFFAHTIYIISDGLKDENKNAKAAVVFGSPINKDGTIEEAIKNELENNFENYEIRMSGVFEEYKKNIGAAKDKLILPKRLQKRLECAFELYKAGRVKIIVVSGYESIRMKSFLSAKGVPEWSIITDDRGGNIDETIKNILKLKNTNNIDAIIIVSQYFNATTIKMLFEKSGFTDISSVNPKYFEIRDVYPILCGFFEYYAYLLRRSK